MPQCNFPVFLALWNRLQGFSTPAVHFKIAHWLERNWEQKRTRLLLMAFRACGKSTLVGLFCVWLLTQNPNLRILILAADLALARKMVRNVKRILEKHPLSKHLKPRGLDQWGSDRFTVRRPLELRDPSVLAKGVFTNLTGTRADVIICDDVEVPNTCDTPDKRKELRTRLGELDYIVTPGGIQLYVGTPHSWFTLYAEAPRTEAGEEEAFLQGFERLVVPILSKNGESAWPERFPLETVDAIRKRTGPAQFTSQMLCLPVNSTDGCFDPDNLRLYDDEIAYSEAGRVPVYALAGRKLIAARAFWDPAFGKDEGDRSILAIVYMDEEGEYWLHHLAVLRVKAGKNEEDAASQQCRQVAALARRFYLPSIAVETNGIGKFLPGILRRELAKAGIGCAVLESPSRKAKSQRILEAFDVVLAARSLHVHRAVLATPFLHELSEYRPVQGAGKTSHDDAIDAVAGAILLEPVRLPRFSGGAVSRPAWQGSGRQERANTEFEV
jgi:hypothetical protein